MLLLGVPPWREVFRIPQFYRVHPQMWVVMRFFPPNVPLLGAHNPINRGDHFTPFLTGFWAHLHRSLCLSVVVGFRICDMGRVSKNRNMPKSMNGIWMDTNPCKSLQHAHIYNIQKQTFFWSPPSFPPCLLIINISKTMYIELYT